MSNQTKSFVVGFAVGAGVVYFVNKRKTEGV